MEPEGIKWLIDYAEARELSKKTLKPIVLFFTGSDWCAWCIKLEEEVLNTPDFAAAVLDKFIFVKADFPNKFKLSRALASQNDALKKAHGVRGFPTLIILDSEGKKIGAIGYKAGGSQQFIDYLNSLI